VNAVLHVDSDDKSGTIARTKLDQNKHYYFSVASCQEDKKKKKRQ